MTISGKARIAGVMGWPVTHSLSPSLHGFWLDRYGIDGAYVPMAVPPEKIERALRALPVLGFRGCNVTIPHKEKALAAVDETTPLARRIGAVNTVIVGGDGSLRGDNTDAFGFMENLREALSGWSAATGPAVVIGAGGAARAIVTALHDAGAPEIRLVNRTRERAETLSGELGGPITVVNWASRANALDGAALVVNTTNLGMTGQPPLDLDLAALPETAAVADIVYNPLETPLLRAAAMRGNATADGLGMLLHQARPGFAAWFGVEPAVDGACRAHILAAPGE